MNFKCPCCGKDKTKKSVKEKAAALEMVMGRDLVINSAYRCPKHNREVGGKEHSYHLQGMAIDVAIRDQEEAAWLIPYARKVGFTGIGRGSNFVHLDVGPEREWDY